MRRGSGTCRGSRGSCLGWRVCPSPSLISLTYPPRPPVRGIGTSIATATNWGANLLIGSTYLLLMAKITPSGAFGFYAGLCFLGLVFVVFCFPETAGLSLEEVRLIFRHGFGIHESERLRREKRALRKSYLDHWEATVSRTGTGRAVDAIISPAVAYPACPHGCNSYVFRRLHYL